MNTFDSIIQRLIFPRNGCWEWTGTVDSCGYGRVRWQGKVRRVHRLFYQLLVGYTPLGLDHLCRNRRCANPKHLEPVTDRENILRGTGPAATNAAKTHCRRGHEFTPENTRFVRPRHGSPLGRKCMECARQYGRQYRQAHREYMLEYLRTYRQKRRVTNWTGPERRRSSA